jgi:uncharacterized membrane protein
MMKESVYTKKCSVGHRTGLIIFLIFMIIALIQSTVAQETDLLKESGIHGINKINIQIHENGFVNVEEELEVNNTIASILAPKNILDLQILDSKSNNLQYDSVSIDNKQLITFYLRSPDERVIRLRYKTLDLISKNSSTWTLKFSTSSVPGRTIVRIEFPPGSDVRSLRPTEILRYPQNLTSPLSLYPQAEDFGFECDYQIGPPIPADDNTYLYAIIVTIVIILISVIYILFSRKKTEETIEEELLSEEIEEGDPGEVEERDGKGSRIKASVLNILEENERRVVELIEESDDEITQAYIYKTTGIPKATLSDLMKRLEKRNIIERKRDGRINWIKLQKWIFNK